VLTVSPTAAEAIALLVEHSDMPESGGIRIAAGEPTEQGTPLAISLVDAPQPDDEVIADGDAAVFLEPQVAPYLDDAVLDAQVKDGEIAFALHDGDAAQPISENGAGPQ
jgi:iron-sulfur cluster assembly protein